MEQRLHGFGSGVGYEQRDARVAGRADGAEDLGRLVAHGSSGACARAD